MTESLSDRHAELVVVGIGHDRPAEVASPTTEQVLRLFSHAERHVLLRSDRPVQVFHAEFTDLQKQVLTLLGVPVRAFRP